MRQRPDHVLDDGVGGVEAELRGVAGVEHHDAVAVGLHLLGQRRHGAADVVEDVAQLRRLVEGLQRGAARVVHAAALGDAGGAGLFGAGGAQQFGGFAQRLFFDLGGVGGGGGVGGVRSGGRGGVGGGRGGGGRVGRGIDGVRVARLDLGALLVVHALESATSGGRGRSVPVGRVSGGVASRGPGVCACERRRFRVEPPPSLIRVALRRPGHVITGRCAARIPGAGRPCRCGACRRPGRR